MGVGQGISQGNHFLLSLKLKEAPRIHLSELKRYLGMNSDTEVMRFALTYAYRGLVEIHSKRLEGLSEKKEE